MNNDYERYEFWHREMKSIEPKSIEPKKERTMQRLIESSKKFDEAICKQEDRSEDISGHASSILFNIIL